MLKREVGQGYSKQAFCGDSGVSPKGVSRKDSSGQDLLNFLLCRVQLVVCRQIKNYMLFCASTIIIVFLKKCKICKQWSPNALLPL